MAQPQPLTQAQRQNLASLLWKTKLGCVFLTVFVCFQKCPRFTSASLLVDKLNPRFHFGEEKKKGNLLNAKFMPGVLYTVSQASQLPLEIGLYKTMRDRLRKLRLREFSNCAKTDGK